MLRALKPGSHLNEGSPKRTSEQLGVHGDGLSRHIHAVVPHVLGGFNWERLGTSRVPEYLSTRNACPHQAQYE